MAYQSFWQPMNQSQMLARGQIDPATQVPGNSGYGPGFQLNYFQSGNRIRPIYTDANGVNPGGRSVDQIMGNIAGRQQHRDLKRQLGGMEPADAVSGLLSYLGLF